MAWSLAPRFLRFGVWWDKRAASCTVWETETQRWHASHRDRKQLSTESNFLPMDHCRLTKSPQCCSWNVQIRKQPKALWRSHKTTDARFGEWGSKLSFIFPCRVIQQLLSFLHFQAVPMDSQNLIIWGFRRVWRGALQYREPGTGWGSRIGGAFSEEPPVLTRKIALWFLFWAGEECTNLTRRLFGEDFSQQLTFWKLFPKLFKTYSLEVALC